MVSHTNHLQGYVTATKKNLEWIRYPTQGLVQPCLSAISLLIYKF